MNRGGAVRNGIFIENLYQDESASYVCGKILKDNMFKRIKTWVLKSSQIKIVKRHSKDRDYDKEVCEKNNFFDNQIHFLEINVLNAPKRVSILEEFPETLRTTSFEKNQGNFKDMTLQTLKIG